MAGVVGIVATRTSLSLPCFEPTESPILAWMHGMFADLYFLIVLVLMSYEGSQMASLFWQGGFFDHDVQVVEQAVWSCQPTMELHQMVQSNIIGEYLMCTWLTWPMVLMCTMAALRHPDDDEQVAVTSAVLIMTM